MVRELGLSYGLEAPFLRPAELATDTARIDLAVRHALEYVEHQEQEQYDYVVLLQNTSPLRHSEDIDGCIQKLLDDSDADSAATVYLAEHEHPLMAKKVDANGYLIPFSDYDPNLYRRQDQPLVYYMNGCVYAVKRDYLMEHDRVIGQRCIPYVMPHWRSIDVHTHRDLAIVEALMEM